MVTIESSDLDCSGISFDVTFDVRGKPAASGFENDPDNSLEINFHSMMVHVTSDRHVLIDLQKDAIESIGERLFNRASNVALEMYLDEIED